MRKGRLGLETARVPYVDRHGMLWLRRGQLYVESGTLRFGGPEVEWAAGDYAIPFQMVTCILLGPGSSITHDALRLCARHGTGVMAVGEDGVRHYASMPFGPDDSALARRQVRHWSHPDRKVEVARRMYALRFGEILPVRDLNALRGIEGSRVKTMYRRLAERYGIPWEGRDYDRANPERNDVPNQAMNHSSTAVEAAAAVAVAACGAIPQLGFIHEDSGLSFVLDVADLYRAEITVPAAFAAAKRVLAGEGELERVARQETGRLLKERKVIPEMIDRIKELLRDDDGGGDP